MTMKPELIAAALFCAAAVPAALAQSTVTPDKVESSIGTLNYKDGAPSKETVAKVYDYLDQMHAVKAFVNAYQGASVRPSSRASRKPACRTTRP